jgi:hypothetical protein
MGFVGIDVVNDTEVLQWQCDLFSSRTPDASIGLADLVPDDSYFMRAWMHVRFAIASTFVVDAAIFLAFLLCNHYAFHPRQVHSDCDFGEVVVQETADSAQDTDWEPVHAQKHGAAEPELEGSLETHAVVSDVLKACFKPGELGIYSECWRTGLIDRVDDDSPGHRQGVREGMRFETIDGKPYTEALLDSCIRGRREYTIAFSVQAADDRDTADVADPGASCEDPIMASDIVEAHFSPGGLGIHSKCWAQGLVHGVDDDSQAQQQDIRKGMRIISIDGKAYTEALLDEYIAGRKEYTMKLSVEFASETESEVPVGASITETGFPQWQAIHRGGVKIRESPDFTSRILGKKLEGDVAEAIPVCDSWVQLVNETGFMCIRKDGKELLKQVFPVPTTSEQSIQEESGADMSLGFLEPHMNDERIEDACQNEFEVQVESVLEISEVVVEETSVDEVVEETSEEDKAVECAGIESENLVSEIAQDIETEVPSGQRLVQESPAEHF